MVELTSIGLDVGASYFSCERAVSIIFKRIDEVRACPLPVGVKVKIIREHLVPKLTHILVLAQATHDLLTRCDVVLRETIKQLLHLPQHTSTFLYHADVKDGSLCVSRLAAAIPLLTNHRFSALDCNWHGDEILESVVTSPEFSLGQRWRSVEVKNGDCIVTTPAEAKAAESKQLHAKGDGRGLGVHPKSRETLVTRSMFARSSSR